MPPAEAVPESLHPWVEAGAEGVSAHDPPGQAADFTIPALVIWCGCAISALERLPLAAVRIAEGFSKFKDRAQAVRYPYGRGIVRPPAG
ncbi:hypothetical protein ABTX99_15060 [Streptomyces flaveolus]|uniref:hypothetical protein n=1 Tax=Streptomyces flaveolus TaxID=67297 RepID=UPI003318FD85